MTALAMECPLVGAFGIKLALEGALDAEEAAGARLLYLPPYSPDNPIENAFAKLKAVLRKAAERSIQGLSSAIGAALGAFTPQECANASRR